VFRTRLLVFLLLSVPLLRGTDLRLNELDYFEAHGLSVLLHHNAYHHVFGDQKMGGLEIILHEQRIATNGDVRLSPSPHSGIQFRTSRTASGDRRKIS
jgi:endoglucanase